jgi:hypothetical protein
MQALLSIASMPATSTHTNVLSEGVASTINSIRERNHVIRYIFPPEVYITVVLFMLKLGCRPNAIWFSSKKLSAEGRSGD